MTHELVINSENLGYLDEYFHANDLKRLDDEIEHIVANLWANIGGGEQILAPFFTTFLQSNLLRPLYIHYFSFTELNKKYSIITINASNIIVDIVAEKLQLNLSLDRSMHDSEYTTVREYAFYKRFQKETTFLKPFFSKIYKKIVTLLAQYRGIDVLYMNAGKLSKDFSDIPRSMTAFYVPSINSSSWCCDVETISKQVRSNIESLKISIPNDCVIKLIEHRVLCYLPDLIYRINDFVAYIKKYSVKLVIVSSVNHEDHLSLLAAAKICGIKSMIISHGFTVAQNKFLEGYVDYQATLSPVEHNYANAVQLFARVKWFDNKKI